MADVADLGRAVPLPTGVPWFPEGATVRWVLLHLIEETARHAGHADIIRESLDGASAGALMAGRRMAGDGLGEAVDAGHLVGVSHGQGAVTGAVEGQAMNEPEIFQLADRTLNAVVARIADHQWDMTMPASFASSVPIREPPSPPSWRRPARPLPNCGTWTGRCTVPSATTRPGSTCGR
jgi:hypothetical protein